MSIYVILRVRRHLSVVLAFLWYDKQSWMFPSSPSTGPWPLVEQTPKRTIPGDGPRGEQKSRAPGPLPIANFLTMNIEEKHSILHSILQSRCPIVFVDVSSLPSNSTTKTGKDSSLSVQPAKTHSEGGTRSTFCSQVNFFASSISSRATA